jgi:uncharacterized lipoprotein YajG
MKCRTVIAVVAAAVTSACAIIPEKIAIDDVPDRPVAPVAGAQAVRLTLSASDRRGFYTDRISTKRNYLNMEMARIGAANDVVDLVRGAVERGLREQGFAIGPGGLDVGIELQAFYNDFSRAAMPWMERGEVGFTLKVGTAGGAPLYSHYYDGISVREFFVSTPGNAKESLEKALNRAIREMLEDKALQQVLLSASVKAAGGRS